ncbi:hypothetical protein SteCoe_17061 [Stentor coeruleus]|uniref:Uncharacterized protein n=1 Tax=Stentor coeruleus TaxID=5963 RepID=A0A1R2BZY4_9CILI|nr:hypothetical protein SteCoe_17061 [Stentor coeruleus]
MTSTLKLKKKISPFSRVLSDPSLSKASLKKKGLSTSRSDVLDTKDNKKLLIALQDSKLIHNVNLQIPFVHSANMSISNSTKDTKKAACLQGFTSKISIKSPRTLKKKKYARDCEKPKVLSFETFESNVEKSNTENQSQEVRYLELELKKAMEENKKIKKALQEECVKDDVIDEMMKSFRSRLYKLLYE